MLDYKVVSLVENKLGEVQDQRERDAMIKYLIQEADFEIAYYLVCTYITKRNVMDLHKSIISNISNSKSTLDLALEISAKVLYAMWIIVLQGSSEILISVL